MTGHTDTRSHGHQATGAGGTSTGHSATAMPPFLVDMNTSTRNGRPVQPTAGPVNTGHVDEHPNSVDHPQTSTAGRGVTTGPASAGRELADQLAAALTGSRPNTDRTDDREVTGPVASPVAGWRPMTDRVSDEDSDRPTGRAHDHNSRSRGAAGGGWWPVSWPHPEPVDADRIAATMAWLGREVAAGQSAATAEVPLLGSAAWVGLADGEPAKFVAVFQAARAWFTDYATAPVRTSAQLREEHDRWEAFAADRDRRDYATFRSHALAAADGIEARARRTAYDNRPGLPNRTGPEILAAARASWAGLGRDPVPGEPAGTAPTECVKEEA